MADGLPNGFVNVAYRDRNNALWFGTLQGLSKLVPTIDGPSEPPPILIQQLRVAGNDLPISELGVTQLGNLEFEANKNQLEIKFVSLGFRSGDVRRYQFMLEGADRDWSAPTNQRYRQLREPEARQLSLSRASGQRGWCREQRTGVNRVHDRAAGVAAMVVYHSRHSGASSP